MPTFQRREFIRGVAGSAAVATVAGALGGTSSASGAAPSPRAVRGPRRSPNETIRLGVIGLNGRGGTHVRSFGRIPNVDVTAVCDVDDRVLARVLRTIERRENRTDVKRFKDVRALLDDPEIDAVSIATPNHWHALAAIWACQAGKDVYVEKPESHNIFEGRQIVKAAEKYGRIVQGGAQCRSIDGIREGIEKLRAGAIGDVYMARGVCYKWRDTIGKADGPQPVPDSVDYNLWLGPAPEAPLGRRRLHYDWHWQWAYGNGDIGNQGPHEMDKARWGLGVAWPTEVCASGGRFMFDDDQETPNVIVATFKYPDPKKMLVFEVRHWMSPHEAGFSEAGNNSIGDVFFGSQGYMTMNGFVSHQVFLGRDRTPEPLVANGSVEQNFANFIDCVRSRRAEDLNCPIGELRISTAHVHMANISYRLGRKLHWDAETETFKNDAEANAMLTREYRAPFVVPREV